MLSTGAFNALLKDAGRAAVLCHLYSGNNRGTQDSDHYSVHDVSGMIFTESRLIRLRHRLSELLKMEGVEAEEKAIRYVAKAGDGSMRDALSLLDQCIAFYLGQTADL